MNLGELFGAPAKREEVGYKPVFVPLLEKIMEEKNRKVVPPAEKPAFRASGLGYCGRKILYQLDGYTDEKTAKEIFTLNLGTAVHEVLQQYIKGTSIAISSEDTVTVDGVPETTGHYDYLLEVNGERVLLEIKTCNVEAFERLVYNPVPYEKHKWQATFYMQALGVKKTYFLYVNKNGQLTAAFAKKNEAENFNPLFLEICYELEPSKIKGNVDYTENLLEHYKNGTKPEYRAVSDCNYCQFKEKCKDDRKVERKLKRMQQMQNE